jgi:hypothetical protein
MDQGLSDGPRTVEHVRPIGIVQKDGMADRPAKSQKEDLVSVTCEE